jgi:hypothetical protein
MNGINVLLDGSELHVGALVSPAYVDSDEARWGVSVAGSAEHLFQLPLRLLHHDWTLG